MPRPHTASVLKMLIGSARPDRIRDEARTTPSTPLGDELPPFCKLDETERAVYDWLLEYGRVNACIAASTRCCSRASP